MLKFLLSIFLKNILAISSIGIIDRAKKKEIANSSNDTLANPNRSLKNGIYRIAAVRIVDNKNAPTNHQFIVFNLKIEPL